MLLLSLFEITNGEKLAKNAQKQYVQVIPRSTDEDMTKIVDYSLIVYFWDTVIFFKS